MSLDQKNEDAEVMIAKGHIYLSENKIYGLNTEYATAFFRAAAAKESLEALCHIANMYYEGDGVDTDYNMAITWAKMAYEAGAPLGLYIYGRAYYEGNGLRKNKKTGEELIRKAAGMKEQ